MKFEEWLAQQDGVIEVDCGCVTTEAFYHWMRVAYESGNSLVQSDCCPVQNQGWIPVSERLPENKPGGYEYLVFETLNGCVNHDYWAVPDIGQEFTPFWNRYGDYVTHWMPLPAGPKEQDNV